MIVKMGKSSTYASYLDDKRLLSVGRRSRHAPMVRILLFITTLLRRQSENILIPNTGKYSPNLNLPNGY